MIDQHTEVEAKMVADGVAIEEFAEFVSKSATVKSRVDVCGVDDYYERGDSVVRHRRDLTSGWHELTVKRRRSDASTRDREEIDLRFADSVAQNSVAAFLAAIGFEARLHLTKWSYIYHVKLTDNVDATFVIYDVCAGGADGSRSHSTLGQPRRYLEIEVEKGSSVSVETAKRHVGAWVSKFRTRFPSVGEPLNESLWEIFTGKQYSVVANPNSL